MEGSGPGGGRRLTRRETVVAAGAAGIVVAGHGLLEGGAGPAPASAAARIACVLTPAKMEGPFFVDELLERSGIRADADGSNRQPGVPLELTVEVVHHDRGCAPVVGATVDVWQANAHGDYSDVSAPTRGHQWLRGHQVTDGDGIVTFRTIYPGWYPGRTIHVHFKVRTFEDEAVTYEFTSQLFFDQGTNDAVQGSPGYDGVVDAGYTTNAEDGIYGGDAAVLVPLTGNLTRGFGGAATVGLAGIGDSRAGDGVRGRLRSLKLARGRNGRLRLIAGLSARERLEARLSLFRGEQRVATAARTIRPGRHEIAVPVPPRVTARRLTMLIELADRDGGVRSIRRRVRIRPPGDRAG